MNTHIPDDLRERWPNYEFVGKPFKLKNGKTYIRAKYKYYPWENHTHIYCMEENWFWHDESPSQITPLK